ncbi:hypothetical protein WKK05_40935 (plasmid) [Nostoc sp. UHCC 0302]|uniref:hypothetical protein n=1 Tax=Nostoc sp. UHCC 0302 TaxID=3134896 RepID=UPI00311CBBCD
MSVKHKGIRTTVRNMNRRYFLIGTGMALAKLNAVIISTVIASCTKNQNSSQQISTVKVGITQLVPEDILKFVQTELVTESKLKGAASQVWRWHTC